MKLKLDEMTGRIGRGVSVIALAVLVGVATMAVPAAMAVKAQELSEAHLKAARAAIDATRSTDRLDDILPTMAQSAKSELIANNPDQNEMISIIVDEAAIALAPRRGVLEQEVAKIFANTFSEAELGEIASFFATEAGQKFLEQSPLLIREIDRAAQVWSNGLRRDMTASIREKMSAAGLQ